MRNYAYTLHVIMAAALLFCCSSGYAWDVQQKYYNTTGQTAYDRMKFINEQEVYASFQVFLNGRFV